MVSMKRVALIASVPAVLLPVFALAQQDVRGVRLQGEAHRIFDEKCLSCHNRQLIDEAVKERREMDKVLRSMKKKGVGLTDREKKVLGQYWGQKLFKGDSTLDGSER